MKLQLNSLVFNLKKNVTVSRGGKKKYRFHQPEIVSFKKRNRGNEKERFRLISIQREKKEMK